MEATLIQRRKDIIALCRDHGATQLEVFGSAADGSFDRLNSDDHFAREREPDAGDAV